MAGCVPIKRLEAPNGHSCVKGMQLVWSPMECKGWQFIGTSRDLQFSLPSEQIHHMVRKLWNIHVSETAGLSKGCRYTAHLGPESRAMPTAFPLSRHEGDRRGARGVAEEGRAAPPSPGQRQCRGGHSTSSVDSVSPQPPFSTQGHSWQAVSLPGTEIPFQEEYHFL